MEEARGALDNGAGEMFTIRIQPYLAHTWRINPGISAPLTDVSQMGRVIPTQMLATRLPMEVGWDGK